MAFGRARPAGKAGRVMRTHGLSDKELLCELMPTRYCRPCNRVTKRTECPTCGRQTLVAFPSSTTRLERPKPQEQGRG